mgnify:CR=1 FL=1
MLFRTIIIVFGFMLLGDRALAESLSPEQLFNALRNGGHTLYFRHAATDWSHSYNVVKPGDWKSCDESKMRQLSDAGRVSAERVGKAIKALEIPIGKVLSSEYCRAVETAERMDLGTVEATSDIMNLRAASFVGGDKVAVARLQRILKRSPAHGENKVIWAHGNLARESTGAYPREGGAVVILATPDKPHGFLVLGQLSPEDWFSMVKIHKAQ